jgi:uncharacterized membrane protein YbhN (UPF0104 family)
VSAHHPAGMIHASVPAARAAILTIRGQTILRQPMSDPAVAEVRPEREHPRALMLVRLLREARGRLGKHLLKFLGFVVFAYLILKLIPGLGDALHSLEGVGIWWVLGLMAIEAVSECGYVVSWIGILDPENLLREGAHGRHLGARVAWAQLGGGMLVPGGTLGSMGVGAWMLHRLGMSMERVAERQFVLMFLNTAVDGLAVIFFGFGMAIGLFSGGHSLALTLLPAVVVAVLLAAALVLTHGAEHFVARLKARRPKLAVGLGTLTAAVEGTERILRRRGSGRIVLGAVVYLGFDMAVLWFGFRAIDADPVPGFAVVAMSYLGGALGGSIPLPANMGAVTGIAAMLIAFGVDHSDAIAAVVLYQAIGLIVPVLGGGVSYLFLRREFGALSEQAADEQVARIG